MREPAFWWRPQRGIANSPARAACGDLRRGSGAPLARAGSARRRAGRVHRQSDRRRRRQDAARARGRAHAGGGGQAPVLLTRGYGGRLAGPAAGRSAAPPRGRGRGRAAPAGAGRADHRCARPGRRAQQARTRRGGERHRDGRRVPESVVGQGFFRARRRRAARHRQRRVSFRPGPLRAPLAAQFARAQALVVGRRTGTGADAAVGAGAGRGSIPVFRARLEPDAGFIAALGGGPRCSRSPASAIRRNSLRRCATPASRLPRREAFPTITAIARAKPQALCRTGRPRRSRPGDDREGYGAHAGRRRGRRTRRPRARVAGDAGARRRRRRSRAAVARTRR